MDDVRTLVTPIEPRMSAIRRGAWTLGVLLAAVTFAWLYVARLLADPHVLLLVPENDVRWIVGDRPFNLSARRPGRYVVSFRKRFTLDAPAPRVAIGLRAFRLAEVWFDGRLVLQDRARALDDWKRPQSIDLTGPLARGVHELLVNVENVDAPPALLLHAETLGIGTGPGWEASFDGRSWTPARLAAAPRPAALSRHFLPAPAALWEKLPLLGGVFGAVFLVTLWVERRGLPPGLAGLRLSASAVRWVLLLAWALLGTHNLLRLPDHVGFDAEGHYHYLRYVTDGRGIPFASDGWQMFQSPLYYLVSAPFDRMLAYLFDPERARRLLRLVPFACGAAQVQLAFLALRRTFPERPELQVLGTAFAGLLPVNLYMAQSLGNEPMAGFLSGAALLVGLGLLTSAAPPTRPTLVGLGVLLGLALLTKVTAALLIPPLLGAIVYARRADPRRLRHAALDAILVCATTVGVAGWYYVRNWIRLGRPFVSGWDPIRGIAWWQDPGYRTPEELVRFGEALVHPIVAGVVGFWDALYSTFWADAYLSGAAVIGARPPWNYGFLLASVVLALIPTIVLLVGAGVALAGDEPRRRAPLRFALVSIGVQLAALLHLYLHVPLYSIAKAHYTLGVVVCYALLLAAGLERLSRRPVMRAALYAGLASWGFAVGMAYVVVSASGLPVEP